MQRKVGSCIGKPEVAGTTEGVCGPLDHLWAMRTGAREKASQLITLNAAQENSLKKQGDHNTRTVGSASTAGLRDNSSGVFQAPAKCPPEGQLYEPAMPRELLSDLTTISVEWQEHFSSQYSPPTTTLQPWWLVRARQRDVSGWVYGK